MLDSLQMGFWRSDATMLMVPDQPFTISPLHPHMPCALSYGFTQQDHN